MSEGDETEIEAKISNVQRKIGPLDIFIYIVSQPQHLTCPVDTSSWTKFNEEKDSPKEFIHRFKTQLGALQVPDTRYSSPLLGSCSIDAASKMEVTLNFTLSETESFFINALMIKNTLIENSIDIVQAAYRVSEIKT